MQAREPERGEIVNGHAAQHIEFAVGKTDHPQDGKDERQPQGHQAVNGADDQAVDDLGDDEPPPGDAQIIGIGSSKGDGEDHHNHQRWDHHPPPIQLGGEIPEGD